MHKEVTYLAAGPSKWVRRYSRYIINGFRFHTKKIERRRKTQNSGVFVDASTNSYASIKDKNPVYANMIFYGVLTDIIELSYANDMKYVLFKCDWVDYNNGCKQDEYNFTLVNFKHLLYKQNRDTDEPFILASQAMQAWYVPDPHETDWHVAIKMTPRDYFNGTLDSSTISSFTNDDPTAEIRHKGTTSSVEINGDDVDWVRADCEGVIVDEPPLVVDNTSEIYSSENDEDLLNAEDEDEERQNDFDVDVDEDDQFSSEDNYDESSEDDEDQ